MNLMNLDLNDWVTCPFDPVHRMKYSKFYNHFVECRKKHPEDRRKQCPYNFSELIEPADYDNHLRECHYQALYFNIGQITKLPEYDAPSHFDIGHIPKSQRTKHNQELGVYSDSDEEFDSVSMNEDVDYKRYYGRIRSLPLKQSPTSEPPQKPVSVESVSEKFTEKRGFGRGVWIRQMIEQKKSAIGSSSNISVNKSVAPKDDTSSDFSNSDSLDEVIEQFKNDPFSITKTFGRGRGGIFRTLIRD